MEGSAGRSEYDYAMSSGSGDEAPALALQAEINEALVALNPGWIESIALDHSPYIDLRSNAPVVIRPVDGADIEFDCVSREWYQRRQAVDHRNALVQFFTSESEAVLETITGEAIVRAAIAYGPGEDPDPAD
jgi:hypothetical protein